MLSLMSKSSNSLSFGSVKSFLEYERVIYHIKSGDMVEIQRSHYKHWVLVESIDSSANIWCFHVTAVSHEDYDRPHEVSLDGLAALVYEPLLDILKNNKDGKPSLCRVNNQKAMAQKMMDMTKKQMPDINQVFKVLHSMKDKIVCYDLKSRNCEHYSTLWKYGIGWSSQVNTYQDILTATLKLLSSSAGTVGQFCRSNGMYRAGLVCLLISSVAEMAAVLIEKISFTLNELQIENLSRLAIAS